MEEKSPLDLIPFAGISDLRGPINVEHNVFVRPPSHHGLLPATWYQYNSNSNRWGWTPYSPFNNNDNNYNDYNCNHDWIDVSSCIVTNGIWIGCDSCEPAEPNIKIIHYLNKHNPVPPHIHNQSIKNNSISVKYIY